MLVQILTLLGSLAMFLYGMSLMSGGLQKMAGNRMRVFMAKMTSHNECKIREIYFIVSN